MPTQDEMDEVYKKVIPNTYQIVFCAILKEYGTRGLCALIRQSGTTGINNIIENLGGKVER